MNAYVLRVVSGVVLAVIALVGLVRARRPSESASPGPRSRDLPRTYGRFVWLTPINPTTVVYSAAVVIGLGVAGDMTRGDGALFVTGAFLASLPWRTLIASVGALLGNLVILTFSVVILLG